MVGDPLLPELAATVPDADGAVTPDPVREADEGVSLGGERGVDPRQTTSIAAAATPVIRRLTTASWTKHRL